MAMNYYQRKIFELELMSRITEMLESTVKDLSEEYRKVGLVQDYTYENHKKVLLWQDEEQTIPKMTDEYAYVMLSDEELSDENREKIEIANTLMAKLQKLA